MQSRLQSPHCKPEILGDYDDDLSKKLAWQALNKGWGMGKVEREETPEGVKLSEKEHGTVLPAGIEE